MTTGYPRETSLGCHHSLCGGEQRRDGSGSNEPPGWKRASVGQEVVNLIPKESVCRLPEGPSTRQLSVSSADRQAWRVEEKVERAGVRVKAGHRKSSGEGTERRGGGSREEEEEEAHGQENPATSERFQEAHK